MYVVERNALATGQYYSFPDISQPFQFQLFICIQKKTVGTLQLLNLIFW
jgi:hypothetical protein